MKQKNSNIQSYRILVGLVSLYLIIAISIGDFIGTWVLLFASVICTLGLSLIIWVPLSWLIGFVILYLINSIRRKSFLPQTNNISASDLEESNPASIVSNDVLAIAQYILKCRKRGASDSQITNRLKWTGWTDRDIGLAFSYLNNTPNEMQPE